MIKNKTRRLLIATHNPGKAAEYAEILEDSRIEWLSLDDVGITFDVEENGATFYENAALKAVAYARQSGMLTLADDSGLEVDALGGKPGVLSARYGGPGLSSADRYHLLLEALAGVPEVDRTARFRCVIVLASGDGTILGSADGVCEGQIAFEPRGEGGFGYDPVFYLPEYGMTYAELPPKKKNEISHRGNALREFVRLYKEKHYDDK